jgi:glycosyltransferase involved in cell wall biosynthesis
MIELTDAPLSTVSDGFAHELTSDPLQTCYFADHLQGSFARRGIVGVNNGLFGSPRPAFAPASIEAARRGQLAAILDEKREQRRRMLEAVAGYDDARIQGHLDGGDGKPLVDLSDQVPVFMMFGRLDPGQKGFDVLARAIEALPRGVARFLLTPIVTRQRPAYAEDLADLAARFAGEVAVYPFRMERGYLESMAGATFAVMPSLYEPFGGATEPYLAGTPVVARATGGLVQQVADLDDDEQHATGILYRERSPADGPGAARAPRGAKSSGAKSSAARRDPGREWRAIQSATSPAARMKVATYRGMVTALTAALERAIALYRDDRDTYARLLANLFERATEFSWEKTAAGYQTVYDAAAGDGADGGPASSK